MKIKKEESRNTSEAVLLFDKSVEKSAKVIKNYPNSSFVDDAIFLMGRCYYEKGDYARSIKKFEELRILFPKSKFNVDGTYYKAMAYLADGSYPLAIRSFEDVAKKWRKEADFRIGVSYMLNGSYKRAIVQFKDLINGYPKSAEIPRTYLRLGECYAEIGELDSMVKYFHRFLSSARTAEKTDSVKIEIAKKMGKMGKVDDGIKIIGDTRKDSLLLIKVDLMMMGKKYDDAEKIVSSIIKSESLTTIGDAYYRLAMIYEEREDFQKALDYYDSALVRASNQVYKIDAERRRSTLSKALELKKNPGENQARARFLLAEIYFLNLDNPNLAIKTYQLVVDSFPNSTFAPKALYATGWIEKNILKKDLMAKVTFDSLISRYPGSVFAKRVQDDRQDNK